MNSIDSRVSGYLSPLQVGHVHRHLLAGWRSKVLKVEWDQSKTIIITDNPVVWDVGKVVCGDVIIKPGAKLTIKCKVIMPPDGRIVVEQGGQLIVDGGLITIANPEGGEYWRGIEVWGTPTAPQNNTSVQGRLTLINKATLEYAKTAVRLSHPQWASVNTGGRVWAFDAVFNNNNRSVAFHKYDFQNSSFFSNCQFLVNDDYSYPTVGSQITMWGVKNISYSRCTIRYERTVPEHDFLLVRGIHSLDAGFQVNQGLFENLQIGISAGDAADVPKYSVGNETIFKRCGRGIHNNAVNYFTIQDNIFQEIGYYEGDLADDGLHYEGVFLASGSGFRLRTNTFEGSYADNSEGTVGICAENTGGEVNKIENNTFDDLSLGLDGVGLNNDEIDPIFGLKFECNTSLVETGHDYFITPPGVATIQGSSQLAAGNNFDPSNNFLVFGEDINNLAANAHIDYFWFNANPPHQNPIDVVEVTPIQIFNSEGENDCDYDNDGGGNDGTFTDADLDNKKSQFYNERDEYYNKKNQLNSLIDGGDTDALVTLVKTAPSSNTMLVRDELLNHSPYLSNVVIREVINRTDLFPSSIMTEILEANPDEIRGKSMLLIAETEGGLSSSELDVLDNANDQTTTKTNLKAEVSYLSSKWHKSANQIIRHYLSDSTGIDYDSLRVWLSSKESLEAQFAIIDTYLAQNNATGAQQALNSINTTFQLGSYQSNHLTHCGQLKSIQINLLNESRTLADLSQTEVAILENIADNEDGIARAQAQHILNFFYGYDYLPKPVFPTSLDNARLIAPKEKITKTPSFLKVQPNPTNNWTAINYRMPEGVTSGYLVIRDLTGKVIEEKQLEDSTGIFVWTTNELVPSIYISSLIVQGNIIHTEKIIVTK